MESKQTQIEIFGKFKPLKAMEEDNKSGTMTMKMDFELANGCVFCLCFCGKNKDKESGKKQKNLRWKGNAES